MSVRSNRFLAALNRGVSGPFATSVVDAYGAAGLDAPLGLAAVDATLAEAPTLYDVHRTLAAEAVDLDSDPDEWVASAVVRLHQALAVEELRVKGAGYRTALVDARVVDLRSEALAVFAGPFDGLAASLTAAARQLPSGSAALDPQANIDGGSVKALAATLDVLERLGTMLSILPIGDPEHVGAARPLVDIVEVPDCDSAEVEEAGGEPLNPDPRRDVLRRLMDDAKTLGGDHAIVAAARGDYPQVSLSLIGKLADRGPRVTRLLAAHREFRFIASGRT